MYYKIVKIKMGFFAFHLYLFNFQDFHQITDFISQSVLYMYDSREDTIEYFPWLILMETAFAGLRYSTSYVNTASCVAVRRAISTDKTAKERPYVPTSAPATAALFKCQKSCQAKRKVAIEPEMIALLARTRKGCSLSLKAIPHWGRRGLIAFWQSTD